MKKDIISELSMYLLSKGYIVKILTRICFDIVARKGERILLLKVLEDANSISEEYASAMKSIARYIPASPVIIAEKAESLTENNIVYLRHGIYAVNPFTFRECCECRPPFVKRSHAGFVALLDQQRLRNAVAEQEISLSFLSTKVGVSISMLQRYLSGESEITLNKALRISHIFGDSVFRKINIFSVPNSDEKIIGDEFTNKFRDIGFDTARVRNLPFEIIAKNERDIIFTELGDTINKQFTPLSKLLEAEQLVIFREKRPKGIPSLTKGEFLEIKKSNQLLKMIKEFG